jgi:hypothetical protein
LALASPNGRTDDEARMIRLLALGAALMVAAPAWGEDPTVDLDNHARVIDRAASTPAGQERVANLLARELNAAWGHPPGPYSAASLNAQRSQNRWGWGEVLIGDRLAQQVAQTLMKQDRALTPAQALAQGTAQVTSTRRQRTGWGAIARASGVSLGGLVSSVEKTAQSIERAEKGADRAADRAAGGSPGGSGKNGGAGPSGGGGGKK